jgi:hypothetical protein
MMEPEYHRELYIDVSGARWAGYAISITSIGAALPKRLFELKNIENHSR